MMFDHMWIVLIFIVMGVFAIVPCMLSSQISREEEKHRKECDEQNKGRV